MLYTWNLFFLVETLGGPPLAFVQNKNECAKVPNIWHLVTPNLFL